MPGPPPPTFSSFPEPSAPPKPKVAPPSFSSFPSTSTSTAPPAPPVAKPHRRSRSRSPPPPPPQSRRNDEPPPPKRPKAEDFLEGLGDEIRAGGGLLPSRHSHDRNRRDDLRSREHHSSSSGGTRKGKGKERDHGDSKEREGDWKRRETESGSGKEERRRRDKEDKDESSRRRHHHRSSRDKDKEEEVRDSDYGPKRDLPYQLLKTYESKSSQHSSRSTPPSAPVASANPTSEPKLFHVDRTGDEKNIRYGGLHKGDIPKYRRIGGGRILGLNAGLRITKESAYTNRGVEVVSNSTYKTPRYVDPRSARHTTNRHSKRLLIAPPPPRPPPVLGLTSAHDLSAPEDPFLPSSSDQSRFVRFEVEKTVEDKLSQLEQEGDQDYRSIAGKVKPEDLDSDDEGNNDDDLFDAGIVGGESQDEYLKRRNVEMDRALRDRPDDVDEWLKFVEFQDEVARASFGGHQRALNKAERTSTSEIKLSILDRALDVPANRSSERLLLAYLAAAAEVWDPKKMLEKWSQTLKGNPELTGLWIEYVSWRQTSWATFQVRNVVEVYVECFEVLRTAMAEERSGSKGRELLEGNAIYLFLRCCLMLHQAGFRERALAAFQSILELNFFRPESQPSSTRDRNEQAWLKDVLDDLELFWDTGGARVGEVGAKGWRNTNEDAEPPVAVPPPAVSDLVKQDESADVFERWVATERAMADSASLPARPDDPGVDDDIDPFRVVLFDDVRDFLFVVDSPDGRLQLVYSFLTFIGLPFVPPDFPTTTPFSTDPFIHSELLERSALKERFWPKVETHAVPFDTISGEAMEPERRSALQDPFDAPFFTTPVTVDSLFATRQKWFQVLDKATVQSVNVDLARNAFTLLRTVVRDTFFTLSFFSLETAINVKVAIKLAKQVLRDDRQNLALWDGYARMERKRGKVDEARAVYVTALSMYRNFEQRDQIDGPLLWRAWAEMEWEEGRPMLALKVLVAAAGSADVVLESLARDDPDSRPSPSQILKARQYFVGELEASFQSHVSQSILRNRNHVAFSFAIFEYIAQGLTPALEILEQHLFRLEHDGATGSAEHEEAYMLCVKLLYRHAGVGKGYRPGQLSSLLERAIKEYPSNSLFLEVFYHNELRMKIQNRVRRVLEASVLDDKVVTSQGWLFAIFSELHFDARANNLWGVRNLFDRAVAHPKTRCSPSIWVLYIDFEIRNNDLKRAKSLHYRALQECPWCKELYLKPFTAPLRSQYRSRELRSMYTLLVSEKGIRARWELDDLLDGLKFSDDEGGADDDGGGMVLDEGSAVLDAERLYEERRQLLLGSAFVSQ